MAKYKIELDEKCKSCNGTGLYVGMGERDGTAVVCHTCKGTGEHHFVYEYENFEGRVDRDDVKHVVEAGEMSYEDSKTCTDESFCRIKMWLDCPLPQSHELNI